jgi:uncharacterized protein
VPHLAGISVYPVKSLEPLRPKRARILPTGALEGDREFCMQDSEGKFVNGKRYAQVHTLRSRYDPATGNLRLGAASTGLTEQFHVDADRAQIETFLTDFFQTPVKFARNTEVGFPDDLDSPGPTIISTGTLEEIARWFPPLDVEQMRLRFRANLEIGGVEPFWEDHLFTAPGSRIRFRIGEVLLDGNNPCQRCVVPPRDPSTGEGIPEFAKIFADRRKESLPKWAEPARFNHFYRLAINTCPVPAQGGKFFNVGDGLEIVGRQSIG